MAAPTAATAKAGRRGRKGRPGQGPRPDLGQRLREIRDENGWTLKEVSSRTGVAISTLSKLENGLVDVTFDTLMRICNGLDLSLHHLAPAEQNTFGRNVRSITRSDERLHLETSTYRLEVLSSEIRKKGMIPTIVNVTAHDIADFDKWNQHPGQEFIFVLSGRMKLYTEFYEPTLLGEGDCAYYDSSMQHAFVSDGKEDAVVLSINLDSSGEPRSVVGHLVDSVEAATP